MQLCLTIALLKNNKDNPVPTITLLRTRRMIPRILCQIGVSLVLALLEVRQHLLERPSLVAVSSPSVVVPLVAPNVEHGVQHAGPSQDLSSSPAAPVLDHGLASGVGRLRPVKLCIYGVFNLKSNSSLLVSPVYFALVQVQAQNGHVGDFGFVSSRLQQEDLPARHLRQPVGEDGSRRSGPHHHEVVRGIDVAPVYGLVLRVELVVVEIGHGRYEEGQDGDFSSSYQTDARLHGG